VVNNNGRKVENKMATYIEHYNCLVSDMERATQFFLTVFPDFVVRGGGVNEKEINGSMHKSYWRHIGNERHYIALKSWDRASVQSADNNRLGFVVDDLDKTLSLFAQMDYEDIELDDSHPFRSRAKIAIFDSLKLELVEYKSEIMDERNDYAL
jgi:catechol-2,3-dioxygenase